MKKPTKRKRTSSAKRKKKVSTKKAQPVCPDASEETRALFDKVSSTMGPLEARACSDEYVPVLKSLLRGNLRASWVNNLVIKGGSPLWAKTLGQLAGTGREGVRRYTGMFLLEGHGLLDGAGDHDVIFLPSTGSRVRLITGAGRALRYNRDTKVFLRVSKETKMPSDTRKWSEATRVAWKCSLIEEATNFSHRTNRAVDAKQTLTQIRRANLYPSATQKARETKTYRATVESPIDLSYSKNQ